MRSGQAMSERILARLLHLANSSPPICRRDEFYALKDRLLLRYAERLPKDQIQEIKKECWGRYQEGCPGPSCRRCGGSGVWDLFCVRLAVYQWGRYRFHRPIERRCRLSAAPDIIGYVKHKDYGRKPREAVLWLYLLTGEWRLLRKQLIGSCIHGAAWWMVGLHVQRIVSWARQRAPKRCISCEKVRFGKGYPHQCRTCWSEMFSRPKLALEGGDDDIPF